jgi:hypothetical protein
MARIAKEEVDAHGTTVANNIPIVHNGAEVGMITTTVFRDILHNGRHKRPQNFSLHFDVPWQSHPLVNRRNRPPFGKVQTQLDEAEVRAACAVLRKCASSRSASASCFPSSTTPMSDAPARSDRAELLAWPYAELVMEQSLELASRQAMAIDKCLGPWRSIRR